MTAKKNWRSELLPKLSGLPLVPCGAGEKFKAPIDPTTGRGMSNWQNQVFTPEEIAAMGPRVICVGTRLGPQAGGIVCFPTSVDAGAALDGGQRGLFSFASEGVGAGVGALDERLEGDVSAEDMGDGMGMLPFKWCHRRCGMAAAQCTSAQ